MVNLDTIYVYLCAILVFTNVVLLVLYLFERRCYNSLRKFAENQEKEFKAYSLLIDQYNHMSNVAKKGGYTEKVTNDYDLTTLGI